MTKLAIFDLDGTLINSLDDIMDSLNKALVEEGMMTYSYDEVRKMVGNGAKILIKRAVKGNMGKYDNVFNKYMSYYNQSCTVKSHPYKGIIEALRKIKEKGIKIAVLSNKPDLDAKKVVKHFFPEDLFDYVLGNIKENRIKPYPDGVFHIMKELNIFDNVCFIGDSSVDIETGVNSSLKTIGVTWGFRDENDLKDATFIINNPNLLVKTVCEIYE